jgi:hypothetical protein
MSKSATADLDGADPESSATHCFLDSGFAPKRARPE